jgi:hypothetical protein
LNCDGRTRNFTILSQQKGFDSAIDQPKPIFSHPLAGLVTNNATTVASKKQM